MEHANPTPASGEFGPQDNPYAASSSDFEAAAEKAPDQLASRGSRFAAALIDGLIALIVVLPIFFTAPDDMSFMEEAGRTALCFVLLVAIQSWFIIKGGQTVGKFAMKIRVVMYSNNAQCSWTRYVFIRWLFVQLLTMIPIVGSILGIIDPLAIFREDRRCLHDLIADTKVVNV